MISSKSKFVQLVAIGLGIWLFAIPTTSGQTEDVDQNVTVEDSTSVDDVRRLNNQIRCDSLREGSIGQVVLTASVESSLRSAPSLTAHLIGHIAENERVTAFSYTGRYWGVYTTNGICGYVLESRLIHTQSDIRVVEGESTTTTIASVPRKPIVRTATPRPNPPRTVRRPRVTRRYIRGPRGGCYYINSNGNRTYVDRSRCR